MPLDAEAPGDVRLMEARACASGRWPGTPGRPAHGPRGRGRLRVARSPAPGPSGLDDRVRQPCDGEWEPDCVGTVSGSEARGGVAVPPHSRIRAESRRGGMPGASGGALGGPGRRSHPGVGERRGRPLPAVDEDACRTLLLRAGECPSSTPPTSGSSTASVVEAATWHRRLAADRQRCSHRPSDRRGSRRGGRDRSAFLSRPSPGRGPESSA